MEFEEIHRRKIDEIYKETNGRFKVKGYKQSFKTREEAIIFAENHIKRFIVK